MLVLHEPECSGDYRSDLDRLLGALTLDGPRVVAHKPPIVAFSDRDRRVPSDILRHSALIRSTGAEITHRGALFEEWRGRGAAGIGLSTGFVKALQSR